MKPIKWLILGTIFTIYLLFGGSIYMVLEQRNELVQQTQLVILRQDIQEILFKLDYDFYNNSTPKEVLDAIQAAKEGVINRMSEICKGTNFLDSNATPHVLYWTFYNSVFFAFTAITTIGYGNLTPETEWSRIFTMVFALFGIPLNGILINNISSFFGRKLIKVHRRSKERSNGVSFLVHILFYLIPGLLVFMIIPAIFFVIIENWGYVDSIYFCFVTLSTIGFGDYVAGMGDGHNIWLWLYKVAIIVWVVFGLGYFVMILGFITKGFTSKKVRTVLEKRLMRIRETKETLARDVDYIRSVVNELYITTTGESAHLHKDGALKSDILNKNRSFSLSISMENLRNYSIIDEKLELSLMRSFSESDIDKFRREDDLDATEAYLKKSQWAIGHKLSLESQEKVVGHLVTSLKGNIAQVIHEAIHELDAYEEEESDSELSLVSDGQDEEAPQPHYYDQNMLNKSQSQWELRNLSKLDKESLLTKNLSKDKSSSNLGLDEIIVHSPENQNVKNSKGIIGRVSQAIRKISGSNKSNAGSLPPSRKVSPNHLMLPHDRKSPIYHSATNLHVDPVSIKPSVFSHGGQKPYYICEKNERYSIIPMGESASNYSTPALKKKEVKISRNSSTNSLSTKNNLQIESKKNSSSRGPSVDMKNSKDLEELLHTLDFVLFRLGENNEKNGEENGNNLNRKVGVDNNGYMSSTENIISTPRRRRRRKVGVFNPDFKFFNHDLTYNHTNKKL